MEKAFPPIIKLNVGGYKFITRLNTLKKYPDSMLAAMFSGRHEPDQDEDGCYFIDRNGKHFEHIIEFLRDDQYLPPKETFENVLIDAEYFCISDLVNRLINSPPLFPHYEAKQEIRKNVKNYLQIKEQVIEKAKSKAQSWRSDTLYSKVCIKSLLAQQFDGSYINSEIRTATSHEEVLQLNTERYADGTLFVEKDDIKDFDWFMHTLLYDLQQEGYTVSLLKLQSPQISNTQAIFNNKIYSGRDRHIIRFDWV